MLTAFTRAKIGTCAPKRPWGVPDPPGGGGGAVMEGGGIGVRLAAQIVIEILLPSARHLKERLTISQSVGQPISQSVSQSGKLSVRQKHTVLGFFSGGP